MTKILYAISITALLCITACRQQQTHWSPQGYSYVQLTPFESSPGCWGYEIFIDNKLYIRQDCIPVISGRHAFKTKKAALDAGKIVFNKISAGKQPTLTAEELKSINVIQ